MEGRNFSIFTNLSVALPSLHRVINHMNRAALPVVPNGHDTHLGDRAARGEPQHCAGHH